MPKPNVIVFFTDQQRWDTTGVHGNPLELTPNFDRMAQSGTHVYNSFTVQPVCGPARSCLQTGLYATQTGSFRNGIPLSADLRTMAHHFKDAGYTTGYIGKWHLADNDSAGAVSEEQRGGYDYWLASNLLEFTSDAYDMVMYDNDGNAVKMPGYRVDAQTDAVIRYVDAHQDEPFFLFVSYIEPHHQNHVDDYPPPDGYRERYTGRWTPADLAALGGSTQAHLGGYFGMVKRLDEALGRLFDALKSLEMDKNTIVLFTSITAITSRRATPSTNAPATKRRSACRLRSAAPDSAEAADPRTSIRPICRPHCSTPTASLSPRRWPDARFCPGAQRQERRFGPKKFSSRSANRRWAAVRTSKRSTASTPQTTRAVGPTLIQITTKINNSYDLR
ncbi:MAG: sulfatase-like hydrolase/transferase [Caldilineaceae bacterium]